MSSSLTILLLSASIYTSVRADWQHSPNRRYLRETPVVLREEILEEPQCVNQLCTHQEDCCENAACISHAESKIGLCARLYDRPEGKLCHNTDDCAPGLTCVVIHDRFRPLGICTNKSRMPKKKQYFDPCVTSLDCDTDKGFCCRDQARIGGHPRRICSYFEDPIADCIF